MKNIEFDFVEVELGRPLPANLNDREVFRSRLTDECANVRCSAITALSRSHLPEDLDRIVEAFDDVDPNVRVSALFHVYRFEVGSSSEVIAKIILCYLADPDEKVCDIAKFILNSIKDTDTSEDCGMLIDTALKDSV